MIKQPIVIDIDGVCVDWFNPFHKLLMDLDKNVRPLPVEGPALWDWAIAYGASNETRTAAYAATTPEWYGHLPKHKEFVYAAREIIQQWMPQYNVTFVTARPLGCYTATAAWLHKLLPSDGYFNLVLTPHRKVMALVAMEPCIIIEDNASTLANFAAAEKDYNLAPCHKILVKRPYNERWWKSNFHVAETTAEAIALADMLLKGMA